jgi:uncharacterized membrane protein (UPF0127 family)
MSKRPLTIFLGFFVLVFISIIIILSLVHYQSRVIVGGKTFVVLVADTEYLQEKGLSGQESLPLDHGMLFIFQKPNNYGFWMKEMKFPIDIVWFDQNFKIIYIEKSLSPETYPKIFYPNGQAMYVLEISAGQSQKLGLQIGDTAQFLKKGL